MTEKTLVTVVTSNRFMAETIARAIDANTYHEGYYYGNGYAVTWTNGFMIEGLTILENKDLITTKRTLSQ